MKKSYRCNLRSNDQLNGKNHQPTFNDFVCGRKSFQKASNQPIAVCEDKLNYIYIYMYTVTIKKND
jgi:hypothetical protein